VVGHPVFRRFGKWPGLKLDFEAASWEQVIKGYNQSSATAWMGGPTKYKSLDWTFNSSAPSTYTAAGTVLKGYVQLDHFSKMNFMANTKPFQANSTVGEQYMKSYPYYNRISNNCRQFVEWLYRMVGKDSQQAGAT
jgi:hypothetical protein